MRGKRDTGYSNRLYTFKLSNLSKTTLNIPITFAHLRFKQVSATPGLIYFYPQSSITTRSCRCHPVPCHLNSCVNHSKCEFITLDTLHEPGVFGCSLLSISPARKAGRRVKCRCAWPDRNPGEKDANENEDEQRVRGGGKLYKG